MKAKFYIRNFVKGALWASMLTGGLSANAQSPYWVFPPNYVDMRTTQSAPLEASPITKQTNSGSPSANAIFESNGSYRFYCAEGFIRDKSGFSQAYNYKFLNETLIIPVPGAPDDYYIFSYRTLGSSSCNNYLIFTKYSYNPTTGRLTMVPNSETVLQRFCGNNGLGLAYHPDCGLIVAGELYIEYENDQGVPSTAFMHAERQYSVSASGIVNRGGNIRGDMYTSIFTDKVTTANTDFQTQELDISPSGLFVAWGSAISNKIYLTSFIQENVDSGYKTFELTVPGTTGITGVEFSPTAKEFSSLRKQVG